MDHKPTDDTATDKRNWRERLGLGGRELPKISGEFKAAGPELGDKPAAARPQPVTKPAPMAPRVPAAKQEQPPPREPRLVLPPAAPQPDALAERLRAQREAAEKLAAQRVSAARERAEAKLAMDAQAARHPPEPPKASVAPAAGRPKFSFAEEEFANARKEASAPPPRPIFTPLTPPRPALGGERFASPAARPAGGQPHFRADQPPPYKPIEPPAGFVPPRRTPMGEGGAPHPAGGRPPPLRHAYDPYRRNSEGGPHEPRLPSEEEREVRRARPMPARGRTPAPVADDDEFLEEEAPRPRRRASASEYTSAYREAEEGYEDDRRRASGPWLLLLALLLAAATTGGIIYYYQTQMKRVAEPASTQEVPVIPAPTEPAKSAVTEPPADQQAPAPAASKKQIYDRIVGEQEVIGDTIVPVDGAPLQPEPQAEPEETPIQSGGGATDDSAPLPLPPPPGDTGTDTQGTLVVPSGEPQAAPPVPAPDAGGGQTPSIAELAAAASETAAVAAPSKPVEPVPELKATSEPETGAVEPVKKKETASKKTAAPKESESLGAEPVILVPPSQQAVGLAAPSQGGTEAAQVAAPEEVPPPVKKKKTLMDVLRSSKQPAAGGQTATTVAAPPPPEPQQQTASVTPETAPVTEGDTAGGASTYVVQLASFRSKAEAQEEYGRLKVKYPDILGSLPSRVTEATVAGSTRFRLGLGPMASRDEAAKICSSLVAAGERDCLVRRR